MKKVAIALFLGSALSLCASEFILDKTHTSVNFKVKHLSITNVMGQFSNFDAKIDYDDATKSFKVFEADVDIVSVDTKDKGRDAHLQDGGFFNSQKFPKATFKMDRYEKKSDNEGKMHGTLTIAGVSKNVVLDTDIGGTAKDREGVTKLGFSLETDIKRKDFNVASSTPEAVIGDKVEIKIEVEAAQK